MNSALFVATASLLCLALGCGSDDSPGTGSGGQAGTSAAGSATTGGTKGTAGASTSGAAGTNAQAGSGGGSNTALSEACQKFCKCHEDNCRTTPIPDGKSCGDFCTAMTKDQLDCRQNMCGLVPAQPDNDHCKHSVGIDQCL